MAADAVADAAKPYNVSVGTAIACAQRSADTGVTHSAQAHTPELAARLQRQQLHCRQQQAEAFRRQCGRRAALEPCCA